MAKTQRYTKLINKYLDQTASVLIDYLKNILPKLSNNWWEKTVIEKLTDAQKNTIKRKGIVNLDGLDLAALIRIFDMNWNEISQRNNLLFEDRNILKEMQAVRNRWSHKPNTGYDLDDIYRDFDTIQRFLKLLGSDQKIIDELQRIKLDIMQGIKLNGVRGNSIPNNNPELKKSKPKDKKHKNSEEKLSELKSLQLEYWKYLEKYFCSRNMKLRLSKPIPENYNHIRIGKAYFSICLTINRENKLGCELYIGGNNAKTAFDELIKEKEKIENELNGIKLEWNRLPDKKAVRIIMYQSGNIEEEKEWNNISEWFRKNTELLYKVFSERIKKIIL